MPALLWLTRGGIIRRVGVSEIIREIEQLPAEQRWQVLERTRDLLSADIPDTFRNGMREIARGDVVELDEALDDLKSE